MRAMLRLLMTERLGNLLHRVWDLSSFRTYLAMLSAGYGGRVPGYTLGEGINGQTVGLSLV
jgi:hypothetical protein